MFENAIPPLPPEYDPQALEQILQAIKIDLHRLRLFLEPAIHNNQNTPDSILDDLE